MPIITNGYNIGTASAQVVSMSADAQHVVLQNLEPESSSEAYARDGYLYLVAQKFDISGNGTALFSMETGSSGLQIEGYEIVTTTQPVFAELIEGATITTTGAAIPSYNLNRDSADDAEAIFKQATAIVGGSAISSELITGSRLGGGGFMVVGKIHTLTPSTEYGMRFVNQGNQTTTCYLQIVFSEKFNGQNDIWVSGSANETVRIRGGETLQIDLIQSQTLSAVSAGSARLGVLQQD